MTMQEIEQDLPCGFHDASLDYFNFDIGNLILVLKFQLLIGHDEKLNRTIYKIGEFTIKHVSFFAIDPYFLFMASKNRPRPKNKWGSSGFAVRK